MRRVDARRRNARALRLRFSRVLGEPSTSLEPGDGAFDDPALRQHDEGVQLVSFDNFDNPRAAACCRKCAPRSLIACVGEDALKEGKQGSRARTRKGRRAVAILDVGAMHRGAQQQAAAKSG